MAHPKPAFLTFGFVICKAGTIATGADASWSIRQVAPRPPVEADPDRDVFTWDNELMAQRSLRDEPH
jgi:hypothetical protein